MTNLSKVGKYEVQDLVGEGAMGVVYRALDPMLNRSVAVKVMNDALALDEDFRTRFLREARAAGSLQHPNVITVYDCGETDGHLYIAMEYVAGTDLEALIESKVPISLADKIEIVIGVLNGLAYAHKRGIVHRDIKPANIRVNEEGRALIMDFGIAHTTSSNVTKTGLIIGTPNYMAPEQVTGGKITPQTDLFSVGVVLYELLTNIKPFEGGTLHSVLFRIVSENPESPDKIVTGVRPDLAEIVMKALAKEPEDRYTSALDMANALSAVSASISRGGQTGSHTISLRSSIEMSLVKEAHEKEKEREQAIEKERSRGRMRLIGVSALAVVAVGTALTLRGGGSTPSTEPVATQQAAANVAAPVVALPAPPTATKSEPSPVVPPPPSTSAPRTTAKADPVSPPTDMSSVLSLQVTTQLARRRAVESGAGTSQLAAGDRHLSAGAKFVSSKQRDAAMREFTQAATAFADAESAARVAAATTASVSAVREQPKPAAIVAAASPPVQVQAPPTPAQPVGNPSAEIAAVIAQYAKAIESRDVAELKRVYPAMSASQANAFDDFFKNVRSLRAAFAVSALQVDGSTADAKLNGTYDFVTSTGRNEHQPLTLQASLRKDGGNWRIVSIK